YMDSVPLVAITANVNLPALGKDSFQEIDIVGVTMPITKHGFIVKNINDLAPTIRKAFKIAKTGRPGPVLVDITKDVTAAVCDYEPVNPAEPDKIIKFDDKDLTAVAEMLCKAKKPFIYVGGGAIISDASAEVAELAELLDAPVCDTLMGKGAFDGHSKRYTGMIGMHGTKASNLGVTECDLLVALGARFSDRVIGNPKKFAEGAKIVHIDVDAAEISKNICVDASLVGDLKTTLQKLNPLITKQNHDEWMKHIEELKAKYPLGYDDSKLTCPYIISEIDRITEGKAVITTDVGQHQMWAAQHYLYSKPRTFLSSGGLGTMGYGLGACIGAQVGRPDDICINIAGDGCFRMNMNELATASRYNLPIIQVVINNHVLGMVRQWQTLFYGKRYSQTVLNDAVDFCKVAEGLGCKAIKITKKEEVEPALKEAIDAKCPVLLECIIEEDDKVFPMVPAGKPLSEVFDEKDMKED
ncbi:MAG: biosynthetic-type acetolactate synthase large subunit, partial [Lachnospiraceae bacterium]|nr:biosynthetic-type acetolactate synthase large subunit [Lachnospiraceae bacterium]